MKKLGLFVMPLMAVSFLSSCGCNNPKEYIVNFESNGGSHVEIQKIKSGSQATEPNPKPTKGDYTFNGWYTSSDFTSGAYDFSTPVTNDLTLYAKWIPTYHVNLQTDYCSSNLDISKTYKSGDVVEIDLSAPVDSKYKLPEKINVVGVTAPFEYNKNNGHIRFTIENSNVTVVANAELIDPSSKHLVTFSLNGMPGEPIEPVELIEGQPFPKSKIPTNPTDPSRSFIGWSFYKDRKDLITLEEYQVYYNLNLYAWWGDIKTYTVTFSANGGIYSETNSETVTRENVPYNTMPSIPDAPTKVDSTGMDSYAFIGYDKTVVPVTGNSATITYTATYSSSQLISTIEMSASGGQFSDGSETKSIKAVAGNNLLDVLAKSEKPTLDNSETEFFKSFDSWVYEDDSEIKDTDLVHSSLIKIKAIYRQPSLEECSWSTIKKVSQKGPEFAQQIFGNPGKQTKTVMINTQPHKVRIIGYGQDVDINGNKIGITFDFADLISDRNGHSLGVQWNDVNNNETANHNFTTSSIRKALVGKGATDKIRFTLKQTVTFGSSYYQKSILEMLPIDLQSNLLAPTKYVCTYKDGGWVYSPIRDKLFLLSPRELGFTSMDDKTLYTTYSYYDIEDEDYANEARHRRQVVKDDYMDENEIVIMNDNIGQATKKPVANYAGCNSKDSKYEIGGGNFWLREPMTNQTKDIYARVIGAKGNATFFGVDSNALGIAPAFCI